MKRKSCPQIESETVSISKSPFSWHVINSDNHSFDNRCIMINDVRPSGIHHGRSCDWRQGYEEKERGTKMKELVLLPFSSKTRRGTPRGSSDVSQGLNRCTSASRKRAPRLYKRFPFWSISSLLFQPRVPKLPLTIEIIDSSSITLGESTFFISFYF